MIKTGISVITGTLLRMYWFLITPNMCREHALAFLVNNHSGDSLHVLQPVGVKVHQELPHPAPPGSERELHHHFLAWCNNAAGKRDECVALHFQVMN